MEIAKGASDERGDAAQRLRQAGRLEQWFNCRSRLDLNAYVTNTAKYVKAGEHSLSKAVLFAALEQVIHKHPALAARLPPLTSPQTWLLIPVVDLNRVVTFVDKDIEGLPTVLEEVFVRPMEFPEDMPLWRLLALRDGTVVFAYDHTFGDGQSGLAFHHALLTALNTTPEPRSEHTGLVSSSLQDGSLPPAIEDALDVSPRLGVILRELAKTAFPFLFAKSTTWTGYPVPKQLTLETTVRILSYSPQEVSSLLQLARAHKTTLTGVLHTLALVIFSRLLNPSPAGADRKRTKKYKTIPSIIPISLRKYTNTPPTAICNHVSWREGPHRLPCAPPATISVDSFPWDTAASLSATLKREAPRSHSSVGLLKFLDGKYERFYLEQLGQRRACGLELSNLGTFPSVTAAEKGSRTWRIEDTLFCQADATLGSALKLNVCGTGARGLGVTITWGKGAVDRSFAEDFVKQFAEGMEVLTGR